jgi:hypothetical protein
MDAFVPDARGKGIHGADSDRSVSALEPAVRLAAIGYHFRKLTDLYG